MPTIRLLKQPIGKNARRVADLLQIVIELEAALKEASHRIIDLEVDGDRPRDQDMLNRHAHLRGRAQYHIGEATR